MKSLDEILLRLRTLRDLQGFRHVFVLVDPLIASVPLSSWLERIPDGKHWKLRDPQVRDASFPCPVLLQLDEDADDLLRETVVVAGAAEDENSPPSPNPAVCGWLLAGGIPADLPRHLVAAMQQRNASFSPVILRYFDPRVLQQLTGILEPEQRQQLLGPVEHWFALDRFGTLSNLQTRPPVPYAPTTLSLTAGQWARIERLEAFNRTVAAFNMAAGVSLEADRESTLEAALERAGSYGMTETDDLVTFALYSLLVHPTFEQYPAVAQAISNFRAGSRKLTDILEALPEQVWTDIGHFTPPTSEHA